MQYINHERTCQVYYTIYHRIISFSPLELVTPKVELSTYSVFPQETWKTYTTADGLTKNSVWSITIDHDDVKWFGTGKGGVSRFDDRGTTHVENDDYLPQQFYIKGSLKRIYTLSYSCQFLTGFYTLFIISK